jgi:hypothetical protein
MRVFAVFIVIWLSLCAPVPRQEKKVIEFGWDEPGTEFVRERVDEMETAPLDGCVFHANYRKPDGRRPVSRPNRLQL